jgi:hypothetical protein
MDALEPVLDRFLRSLLRFELRLSALSLCVIFESLIYFVCRLLLL